MVGRARRAGCDRLEKAALRPGRAGGKGEGGNEEGQERKPPPEGTGEDRGRGRPTFTP